MLPAANRHDQGSAHTHIDHQVPPDLSTEPRYLPNCQDWIPTPRHRDLDNDDCRKIDVSSLENLENSLEAQFYWDDSCFDQLSRSFEEPTSMYTTARPSQAVPSPSLSHHCTTCSERFPALHVLERHARDSGHKPFICSKPDCGKVYSRQDTYIRHIATHKQSSHVCHHCTTDAVTKAFVRKDHWLQHMRKCHPDASVWPARKHECLQDEPERRQKPTNTYHTSLSEALRAVAVDGQVLDKIEEKYDLRRELNTEQLMEVFAMLTLVEPERLPLATKQRLEQKARRAPSL